MKAPRRVVMIVDRSDDALAERVRAEVAGLGLAIVTLEPWRTHDTVGPLEAVARAERAAAVLRVLPSRKGVEVWMADETSGRSLLRQVIVDESPGGPNQSLVALQTAELLRTSLLSPVPAPATATASPPAATPATSLAAAAPAGAQETPPGDPPSGPPSGPPSVPTVAAVAPAPDSASFGVRAGLGPLFSSGGSGTAIQAWMSARGSFPLGDRRWGVALDLSAPARGGKVSGVEGSSRIDTYLAGIAILMHLEGPSSRAFGSVGAGGGVVRVGGTGRAAGNLVGTSASVFSGAAYLRADAGIQATRWLRLGVMGVGGFTTTKVALTFAGNDAGTWGRPFAAALGVVEIGR